jgi:hypothetical protein
MPPLSQKTLIKPAKISQKTLKKPLNILKNTNKIEKKPL